MYHTIIIDCQTKTAETNCEDCIAYKTCTIQRKKEKENLADHIEFKVLPIPSH